MELWAKWVLVSRPTRKKFSLPLVNTSYEPIGARTGIGDIFASDIPVPYGKGGVGCLVSINGPYKFAQKQCFQIRPSENLWTSLQGDTSGL